MTNTINSAAIVSTVSANKARKFAGVSRTTGLRVPLELIKSEEGFNARMDSIENAHHIDEMAKAFGLRNEEPTALEVVPVVLENGEEAFKMVDGHCTFQAILKANKEYGAQIDSVEVKAKELSVTDQRFRVLTSNNQKKLNMIERGKMFSDIVMHDGLTQTQVAERLGISLGQVNQCIMAYNMPEEIKKLVADGLLSDVEAVNRFRTEIKSDTDEEIKKKAEEFSKKVIETSEQQVAEGGRKRVTAKSGKKDAQTVRFNAQIKTVVTEAMRTLNTSLNNVEDGQGATITLTPEQVAILKKAGQPFEV